MDADELRGWPTPAHVSHMRHVGGPHDGHLHPNECPAARDGTCGCEAYFGARFRLRED